MLSLDTKFYELSIKGWIIIMFLVVFFFIFNFNTNEAFSNSEKKIFFESNLRNNIFFRAVPNDDQVDLRECVCEFPGLARW